MRDSLARKLAPVLTAVVLAGRVGSAEPLQLVSDRTVREKSEYYQSAPAARQDRRFRFGKSLIIYVASTEATPIEMLR